MLATDPIEELGRWIDEAREAGAPHPAAAAFVTVGADGGPSVRTVTLKRLEDDALLFTSALWTRKARELAANPRVALLLHWPSLGRQVHLTGEAAPAERALAEELFDERDGRLRDPAGWGYGLGPADSVRIGKEAKDFPLGSGGTRREEPSPALLPQQLAELLKSGP